MCCSVNEMNINQVYRLKLCEFNEQNLEQIASNLTSSNHNKNINMFYLTVENKTNIVLTHQRMTFLNKGLQCDLYYKPKSWITTLTLEAKITVSRLSIYEKEFMKYPATKKLWNL